MKNEISTLEEKMKNVEQNRQFDSETLDSLQAKQGEIDLTLKKLRQIELQQKEMLLDLQSRETILYFMRSKSGKTKLARNVNGKSDDRWRMSWNYPKLEIYVSTGATGWGDLIEIKHDQSLQSSLFIRTGDNSRKR